MLKKNFISLLVLGIIVFASFFVFVSATRTEQPANTHSTESVIQNENDRPHGDFILESFIGSVLIDVR